MKSLKNIFSCLVLLLPVSMLAQSLQVTTSPGLQVTAHGSLQLVFEGGDFINNGTFNAGGSTVRFTSGRFAGISHIGGSNAVTFNRLIIDRPANVVHLGNDIMVTNEVVMTNGNLLLDNYTLDLANTGRITGERNSSYITGFSNGKIKVTADLQAPHSINPGNIGFEISSMANLGHTVITRSHSTQVDAFPGQGIDRIFSISPQNNVGLQATIKFYYLDPELGTGTKNTLSLFARREGENSWTMKGKDNSDVTANWVIKNNIDQLHSFTLRTGQSKMGGEGQYRSLQLFPNPYTDHFSLMLFSDKEADDVVSFYDQAGHLLAAKRVHWNIGMNKLDWNESKFAKGIYYLFSENTSIKALKIIKQ